MQVASLTEKSFANWWCFTQCFFSRIHPNRSPKVTLTIRYDTTGIQWRTVHVVADGWLPYSLPLYQEHKNIERKELGKKQKPIICKSSKNKW